MVRRVTFLVPIAVALIGLSTAPAAGPPLRYTPSAMARIIVADDNDAMRDGMALTLSRQGHEVLGVKGGAECLAAYARRPADVVVTDLRMVPVDGLEVVRRLRDRDPDATVVVVSAHGTIATAVDAMRAGATDFIEKPFSPEVLRARVEKAAEIARERRGARTDRGRAEAMDADQARERDPSGMVGDSEPMRRALELVRKVAATDATVLVLGESGTGKELVARALHAGSRRAAGPFVTISCAAIPESLLESELFGHERGAFTGAVKKKLGRFELADGGTLFLDEVGELPHAMQVKLLRVLQERKFRRLGGTEEIEADIRIIAATNRDLTKLVGEGKFREDLFYRINVIPVRLPPLRDRLDDIPLLAEHFLAKYAGQIGRKISGVSPEAMRKLQAYPWPGNIRELENAIERAVALETGPLVEAASLPEHVQAGVAGAGASGANGLEGPLPESGFDLERHVADIEREYIAEALRKSGGVKSVQEIMNVQGVGEKNFAKLQPFLTAGEPSAAKASTH